MVRIIGTLLLALALLISPIAGAEEAPVEGAEDALLEADAPVAATEDALSEAESGDQAERVLSILEGSNQDPTTFEDYDKLATIAYAKGEYDEALTYLDECIALAGTDNVAILGALYTQKGVILRLQEKTDEALAALDQAAAFTPYSVQMLYLRSDINLEAEAYEAAKTDLEIYVTLLPEDADAWDNLSIAYRALEEADKADAAQQQAHTLREDDGSALLTAARQSAMYGELENANNYFVAYLDQGTDENGMVHFLLAGVRMELGFLEEAVQDLETALALGYPEPGVCYEYLSSCHFQLGNYEKVIETGNHTIQSGSDLPAYDTLYQRMGVSALSLGRIESAVEYFTSALEANDALYGTHYYRGIALLDQGVPEDAIADLTESIARAELVQRSLYYRGVAYLRVDNLPKGVSDLEQAMEMTDEADIAQSAEELLWQLAMQMISTPEE